MCQSGHNAQDHLGIFENVPKNGLIFNKKDFFGEIFGDPKLNIGNHKNTWHYHTALLY